MEVGPEDLDPNGCSVCAARKAGFCSAASLVIPGYRASSPVGQHGGKVSARRVARTAKELGDHVAFVCSGWGMRAVHSHRGRQILSVLLAGDLVSGLLPPTHKETAFLEAITPMTYRLFKKPEIMEDTQQRPAARNALLEAFSERVHDAERLVLQLGRGSAEQRVAGFLVNILDKQTTRKALSSDTDLGQLGFPLRQRHIAEATGLSNVHVSNVLGQLHRKSVLQIADRQLTILDQNGLQRLASV